VRTTWYYPLFLLLAAVVFYPSIHGEFIMDDWGYITTNAHITATSTPFHFWTFTPGPDYWPLSYTFYWIFYRLFGENPTGYHVMNVLMHALNTSLVFLVARFFVPRTALWAALLFLVHPLHVQAVSWIIQFKTLLATALVLGSLLAHLYGRRPLSIALFAVSMLAKSSGLFFPFVLAALNWQPRQWRGMLLSLWPYLVISLAGGLTTLYANHLHFVDLDAPVFNMKWYQHPMLMFQSMFFYLGKFFWPSSLSYIYPHLVPGLFAWWVGLYAILLMGIGLVMARVQWLHRDGVFFICYLLLLLPCLGLITIPNMKLSLVADHWAYLPDVFMVIMVAQLLSQIPWPKTAHAGATLLCLALAVLSAKHAATFATEEGFWQRARELNPDSAVPAYNLGTALDKKGRTADALHMYKTAIGLDPFHARAWYNAGRDEFLLGNLAAAREGFSKAIQFNPLIAASFVSLAKVNMVLQQNEKALDVVTRGLIIHPEEPELLKFKAELEKSVQK